MLFSSPSFDVGLELLFPLGWYLSQCMIDKWLVDWQMSHCTLFWQSHALWSVELRHLKHARFSTNNCFLASYVMVLNSLHFVVAWPGPWTIQFSERHPPPFGGEMWSVACFTSVFWTTIGFVKRVLGVAFTETSCFWPSAKAAEETRPSLTLKARRPWSLVFGWSKAILRSFFCMAIFFT